MKALDGLINEEFTKSVELRNILFDCDDYDQAQKIMLEQDKHYNKYLFFKRLKKALEGVENVRDFKSK